MTITEVKTANEQLMKHTALICDRCNEDYSNESSPVEHFYIRVGGHNYLEDDVTSNKDYCRACIASIRLAIVRSLTTGQA